MKVACVTSYDAQDIGEFKGRTYYMTKSLAPLFTSLEYIGPLKKPKPYSLLFKAKKAFYESRSKRYLLSRDEILIKEYSRQVSQKLSKDVDIVFSPTHDGSHPIAYLDCQQPIVIWTDISYAGLVDYYSYYSKEVLCQETLRDGIANERATLNRCSLVIYKSEWAAQTVINTYQIEPSKVKVVPVGSESKCNWTLDDVKTLVEAKPANKCKLLFVGLDWQRKGGDIVVQVAKALNDSGLDTELTIVGCQPNLDESYQKFTRVLGFISKTTPQGLNKINQLFAESHFLIMPSKFDHAF